MTVPGERPFNPVLGSNVYQLLFENFDNQTAYNQTHRLKQLLTTLNQELELDDVEVVPDFDNHEFNVIIDIRSLVLMFHNKNSHLH